MLCLAAALSGCIRIVVKDPDGLSVPQETASEEAPETTENADGCVPVTSLFKGALPNGENLQVLFSGELPETETLYYASFREGNCIFTIAKGKRLRVRRFLLEAGTADSFELPVLAPVTDEKAGTALCRVIALEDGCAYYECEDELIFYDASFQETGRVKKDRYSEVFPAGKGACSVNQAELKLYRPDGTTKTFEIPKASFAFGNTVQSFDGGIWFLAEDPLQMEAWYRFDLEKETFTRTGVVSTDQAETTDTSIVPGAFLGPYAAGRTAVYDLSEEEAETGFVHALQEKETVIGLREGTLLTAVYVTNETGRETYEQEVTLRTYAFSEDTAGVTGKMRAVSPDTMEVTDFWIYDGYAVFLSSNVSKTAMLLALPVGNAPAGNPAETCLTKNPGRSGLERFGDLDFYEVKEYPRASYVERETSRLGVGFYFGEDARLADVGDYELTMAENRAETIHVETAVADWLRKFPEGLLDDVIAPFEGMDVFFVREIKAREGNAVPEAAAYVDVRKNRLSLVIAEGSLRTISHEFMHCMKLAGERYCYNFLWLLQDYNPGGFRYAGTYKDLEHLSVDYTPLDSSVPSKSGIYFVAPYAKVNASEDTALIFEEIAATDGLHAPALESLPLQKKAAFLFEELRRAVPSIRDKAPLFWETTLAEKQAS